LSITLSIVFEWYSSFQIPLSSSNFLAFGFTLPLALTPELSALIPSNFAFIKASAIILLQEFPVHKIKNFFF